MHLYYDIPKPLKFNGNDLKDELRKDRAMEMDIKRDQTYQTCMVSTMTNTDLASKTSKRPLLLYIKTW